MTKQLDREPDFLNAVLENAGVLVVVLDHEGRIRRFNRASERLSGYSFAEVVGKHPWDTVLPLEDAGTLGQNGFDAIAHDPQVMAGRHSNCWLSKSGARHRVDWSNTLLRGAGGNMEFMVSVGTDITARVRAEESLRQSAARLRHTQAIANIGSWELDRVTGFLTWSEETYRIFGHAPAQFSNTYAAFLAAVHPADRDAVNHAYQHAVDQRTPYDITHRIVRPDGAVRWVQERGETIYGERGVALRTFGAVQDITARKVAEDALRATNQIVAAVLDTTPVLIAYLDTDMNFVRVNAAYAAADQKAPDYFAGKNHFTLYPHAEHERIFRQVVATGVQHVAKAMPFEYEKNRERGVARWDWTLTPIKDGPGDVTGLVLSLTNVSDRIEALEAAKSSAQELKALAESLEARVLERTVEVQRQAKRNETILSTTSDGFFSADITGRIQGANPAFCAMLGYSEAELSTMTIAEIEADAIPHDVAARAEKVLACGHDRVDTRHLRKDGGVVDVEISTSLVDIGGERMFYAFARDITARKESQAALIRARDEAERANKAKSDFLSRMSHELRTPMNAILGFAQILEMEKLTTEHLDFVHEIHRAGDHLLDLINELLDLSRIEAGKLVTVVQPLYLGTIVAEAIQITGPLLTERGITLHDNCDPRVAVLADATRLTQILVNLLSNAAKYNRNEGTIAIACHARGEDRLRICVTDTGQGIHTDKLALLFTPFERLGAEFSAVDGTGIGLALSRQLAEFMDGSLGVESRPGQGSTFWLELPLAHATPEPNRAPAPLPAPGICRHTVLYVEDNAANLRLVEGIFRHHPHLRLLAATNGEYGLELARRYTPDAILLDIHLPGMDGYAVLNALRADAATRDIPVIALSADAMPIDIERGLAAGFRHYLTKPVKVTEVTDAVDRAIRQRATAR